MQLLKLATAVAITASTASLYMPFQTMAAEGRPSAHAMENVASAKWGPAPPMLPPGAQIAVLAGDPTKATRYTVRLKFPANYTIPPHTHPEDENVVVVSGELFMQMGSRREHDAGSSITPGGFALAPAGAAHSAWTKAETTIVLYGQGPVEFNYLNAADDPRTRTSTRK